MKKIFIIPILVLGVLLVNAQEDHAQLIEGPFNTPQEVTQTCHAYHDGVDTAIMKTRHWN